MKRLVGLDPRARHVCHEAELLAVLADRPPTARDRIDLIRGDRPVTSRDMEATAA